MEPHLTNPDERSGMPSASTLARTMACPAWLGRSAALKLAPVEEKTWTTGGTLAHSVLAGEIDDDEIDDDEIDMAVGICRHKEEMLLVQSGFEDYETIIEKRMWLLDDAGNRVASAKPDRVHIEKGRFFTSDFKTGRKDALEPALNPQLIIAAVLIAQDYGITDGVLAIVPAWRKTPPVAEIGSEEIAQWRAAILSAVSESQRPGAGAKTGPHCQYCPVRPFCDEAWDIVRQASKLDPSSIMQDQPEQITENFDIAKHAEGTIKAFLEQIKARLGSEPDAIPGLTIGKGGETKTIPGSLDVFNTLTEKYSTEIVLRAVKWTPTALAKAITPGKGQKATQKNLEEEFSDIIVRGTKAGSLERV